MSGLLWTRVFGRRFGSIGWRGRLAATVAAATAVTLSPGCTEPGEDIPPAEVRTVEAYGVRLDEAASPTEVVYVLLRSLADDVRAAQAHDDEKQKAAMRLTYSLAAYTTIEQRLLELANQQRVQKRTSLGDERDSKLFEFTKDWAPIVAHYVDSFETDLEKAVGKMEEKPVPNGERTHVLCEVSHDPRQTDPAKQKKATLDIELAKEEAGGRSYWRVARIGYRGRQSPQRVPPATGPVATATAPG